MSTMLPSDPRVSLDDFSRRVGDGNLVISHPAERAAWIWAARDSMSGAQFVRFTLPFTWRASSGPVRFHLSADQRYQLFLDNQPISYGPDRSDLEHWPATSLEVSLEQGMHRLTVLVWTLAMRPDPGNVEHLRDADGDLPPFAPMAQTSFRGGFLFAADDDAYADIFNTGKAAWAVEDISDALNYELARNHAYHDIGPSFIVDLGRWHREREDAGTRLIFPPLSDQQTGVHRDGWVISPTRMPEQARALWAGGRIRGVRPASDGPWQERSAEPTEAWQALLDERTPLEIEPEKAIDVLWDFDTYRCGYPVLTVGSKGTASVEVEWAESLYHWDGSGTLSANCAKGDRAEVAGKYWHGFGDTFTINADGGDEALSVPGIWWRSGRYIRLRIKAGMEPVTLSKLAILTTRYPFAADATWTCSDAGWNAIFPMLHRALEESAHETWVDCPYYEQMMYIGDTRLHMLSNYVAYRDVRLTERGIELLNWSRAGNEAGLAAERYPSGLRQDCPTYAMMWVWMVHDYMLWQDNPAFVRDQLVGMRQLIESILQYRREDYLLNKLPGWPFIDWVDGWATGCGPGVRSSGDSSIVNLHLVQTLVYAAGIEDEIGASIMAERYRGLALETMQATVERYWDADKGLFVDTLEANAMPYSEHAQVLAMLTGLLSPDKYASCLKGLLAYPFDARCTIYFSFYVLEALAQAGEADAFFERLEFWRALPEQGFTALPEKPEPSRSDCHGWGAHPLFHSFASIAGIRPVAPGFKRVRVKPMPGPIDAFSVSIPHPQGTIQVDKAAGQPHVTVWVPDGVEVEVVDPDPA